MSQATHVTNIALVGATGQVGSHVLRHLQTSSHPFNITVLTRADSKAEIPTAPNLKIARVDYSDHSSLTSALTGSQILIISLSVFTPKEAQSQLIDAAAATNTVKYIIPNEWGIDWTDPAVNKTAMVGEAIVANREYINSKSLSWISVSCGFWYEYSLGSGPSCYGFDLRQIPGGTVHLFDGGDTKINTSTWNHVGEGVTAMLRLPIHPSSSTRSGDDKERPGQQQQQEVSIETTFANSFLRLSSFTVSQNDMLASLCRVTDTPHSAWNLIPTPTEEWLATGRKQLGEGNRAGFGKLMYGSVMQAVPERNGGHPQAYQAHKGLHDKVLGLQEEDLDEATKAAVDIAKTKIKEGSYWV